MDTFPAFLVYWAKVEDKSLDDQVEGWVTEYRFRLQRGPLSLGNAWATFGPLSSLSQLAFEHQRMWLDSRIVSSIMVFEQRIPEPVRASGEPSW